MKMQDIKIYKQKDLVLKVNQNYDPTKLDLDAWDSFLDKLCEGRIYQKEAIKNAVIFLASEQTFCKYRFSNRNRKILCNLWDCSNYAWAWLGRQSFSFMPVTYY